MANGEQVGTVESAAEPFVADSSAAWWEWVPDGVVGVDARGHCTVLNARARLMLEVSAADVLGMPLRDAFNSTDNWRVMRLAEQCLKDGGPIDADVFHPASLRWLHVQVFPSEDRGANVFLTDITDRHVREDGLEDALTRERTARLAATRAAQALAHSEAQFRAMGDTLPYGVWLADGAGRVKYASPSFEALVGGTAQDDRWLAAVHPEDRDAVERGWHRAVRDGAPWDEDVRFVRPDGSVREVLCRGMPVEGLDPGERRHVGVHLDITARKARERARLQQWTALADGNPFPVALLEEDGRCRYANPALHALLGAEPGTLVGRLPFETQPDGARARESAVFDGGGASTVEELWPLPGGDRRMLVTRFPVPGIERAVDAVALHAVDLSALVPSGAALDQARQKLAGTVAHELNNILTSLIGNTRLVEETLVEDSEPAQIARSVIASAERVAHLAFQLQAYGGSAARSRRTMQPLDEARAVVDLMRDALPETVRVKFEPEPRCPWVEADPSLVRHIVMALLTNAAEACVTRGTIRVNVGLCVVGKRYRGSFVGNAVEPGRYACIEVRDNGTGMDARTLARAFDPFFTTRPASRGMGLPMVLGLVRGCGGGLELESTPGQGTTVRVLIPGVKREAEEPTPAPERPVRVVLVHAASEARRALGRLIADCGHVVMPVADVVQARRSLSASTGPWEVVLLDASEGTAAAERAMVHLRRIDSGLAVVMLGVPEDAMLRARLTSHGVDGFLPRDPGAPDLQRVLTVVLGTGRALV